MRVTITGTRNITSTARDLLSRVVRPHTPVERVQRRQIPYWQERGWTRQGNQYRGTYQTAYGAFTGWIEQRLGNHIDFFLHNPPPALQRHSHWSCFQDRGDNWYAVHMSRRPADVSSGIITIERLLTEALED
jgi:hypothetical protein